MRSESEPRSTAERRVLGVFAHPDDESYGPGGTLAQCALDGHHVEILMFTCGEAGTIGPSKDLPADELCERRRRELAAACEVLGVRAHRVLGVPDRGVSMVDRRWALDQVLEAIERVRPHVVVTFHRDGVSGHPDHIAVAGFVAEAFDAAGADAPARVFEWGIPAARAQLYDRPGLRVMPDGEVRARVMPSEAAIDRKLDAIRAHATQYDFFLSMQARFDYRAASVPEVFALRRARVDLPRPVVEDLFEGLP